MKNKKYETVDFNDSKKVDYTKLFCGNVTLDYNKIFGDDEEFDCSKMFCGIVKFDYNKIFCAR